MIRIRTFIAPDDQTACEKFIVGHRKLLEIYGISKITSNRHDWVDDRRTIVILVEDTDTKKVYGGARVQLVSEGRSLPIETAIGRYDENIYHMIAEDEQRGGTCEICGLWNSREVAGMGIGSYILSRVGVAITKQLPVVSLFVLCAPITVKMGLRLGCTVERELGNNGLFYYPKDDLVATVMRMTNVDDLSRATELERNKIMLLRANPHQFLAERGPKGTFDVEYDLAIPNAGMWQKQ
ncbi:hypothetical protein [Parapedobacter indicus]|uniref:N-acetyltransferase domain-containing protein n=1 Tax=Parapedobacter indicus TaxID=1477437 RepID=A0A1I3MZD8_9SPHI|nr:hypothetical protein [Parapedobacter indicus]PPL00827.1 hypothetical protein CLV26_10746 [Parapedobacter indicus]SFJ02349.1 hypothetical protein SAMN05444682_10746 [Parapedobacter indicus]